MRIPHYAKKMAVDLLGIICGLALTSCIAMLAIWLSGLTLISTIGLGALTLSIMLGFILGNTIYPFIYQPFLEGVQFAKQRLLRLGIILYGFNLTFQQVLSVGASAIVVDILTILSTFLLALWFGKRLLGLDDDTSILIGAGASICGAAAVMATEPIIKAESSKVAVAISTVVIFGTLAMFLFPWLYEFNQHYQLVSVTQSHFGIYLGSAVHEVAQVVAAGHSIGDEASDSAVITKMIRVIMLAPFLLFLSFYVSRCLKPNKAADAKAPAVIVPWFAILFIMIAGVNSLHLLTGYWVNILKLIDTVLLTMAMAALGLTTHLSAIRRAGAKPLALAGILFLWLVIGGLFINIAVNTVMA